MFHYWYMVIKILLKRKFQKPIEIDETIEHTFRVRLLDCDGLRVMTASKYPAYMDFIRWELIARSKLYSIVLKGKMAPSLGSQKIIYRKPLKRGTKFNLKLESGGVDTKWVYHIHKFEQKGQLMAIGITRALLWKKDVSIPMNEILQQATSRSIPPPPHWIVKLFESDKDILENSDQLI